MNKNGDTIGFLPMVLIKLIFALLLILLITWLLINLWGALFGNDDETERDNFETLFKLIESKSQSTKPYESTRLTIYLVKTSGPTAWATTDHTIQFFPHNQLSIMCTGGKPIYRPSDCSDKTKPCLCLYDSDPDRPEDEKDDDVIMCKQFTKSFDIAKEDDFQLSNINDDCKRVNKKEYNQLIVGVQNVAGKKRVFVWQDTPENRFIDEQLKLKECPEKTGVCAGIKTGEIAYDFQKVNAQCVQKDPNKFYSQATCIYDGTKCDVECIGTDCSTISTCNDFNINKDFYVKNTKEEFFCNSGSCNKQCSGHIIEQYTCLPNKDQECRDLINDISIPDFISNCAVTIGPFSKLTSGKKDYNNAKIVEVGDIIGFDDKKQNTANINCVAEIEKYFKGYNVLMCIPGVDCNSFVITSPKPAAEIQKMLDTCGINPERGAGTVFITQYDACPGLENYFTQAYSCKDGSFVGGGGQFGGSGKTGSWSAIP